MKHCLDGGRNALFTYSSLQSKVSWYVQICSEDSEIWISMYSNLIGSADLCINHFSAEYVRLHTSPWMTPLNFILRWFLSVALRILISAAGCAVTLEGMENIDPWVPSALVEIQWAVKCMCLGMTWFSWISGNTVSLWHPRAFPCTQCNHKGRRQKDRVRWNISSFSCTDFQSVEGLSLQYHRVHYIEFLQGCPQVHFMPGCFCSLLLRVSVWLSPAGTFLLDVSMIIVSIFISRIYFDLAVDNSSVTILRFTCGHWRLQ